MNITVIADASSHKYQTAIKSYEYQRSRPGQPTPKQTNASSYFFPLPLQMPEDHYGANVKDFDLAEVGTAIDTFRDLGGASMAEKIASYGLAGTLAVGAAARLTGIAGGATDKFLAGGAAAAAFALPYLGAYQGVARNPHTALLFDGMGLRQFQFNFRLAPRNVDESYAINDALREIKERMHPSYNSTLNSFALDYPYLFEVDFLGFSSTIQGLPKVAPSFLINLSVNTASQGNAFYKFGQPAIIDVAMTFKEIDMKTRETLTGNYAGAATSSTTDAVASSGAAATATQSNNGR
jgi:hypothetical protein